MDENPQDPGRQDDDRLKGWKEIALVLRTSVRTVQRWERSLRLPVHRIETTRSAIVYASRRELEAWLQSMEGRAALSEQSGAWSDPESPAGDSHASDGSLWPRADVATRSWRRTLRAAVVVAAVVLVGATLALAMLVEPNWFSRRSTEAALTGSSTPDRLVSPAGSGAVTKSLRFRLTFADGTTASLGIPVGRGGASCSMADGATYTFSVELLDGGARIHVGSLAKGESLATSKPRELAVLTLGPGQRVALGQIPGLLALEWLGSR